MFKRSRYTVFTMPATTEINSVIAATRQHSRNKKKFERFMYEGKARIYNEPRRVMMLNAKLAWDRTSTL